jgi:CRISPR system Cascade subunit CasE
MRLHLPQLYALAKERGLSRREVDLGYLVHCQLGELFRESPPRLFALPVAHQPAPDLRSSTLEVVGYSEESAEALLARARTFASPERWAGLVDGSLRSKPMPGRWEAGMELGFEVRVCPVVRSRRAPDGSGPRENPREIDAFLARVEADPESPKGSIDREEVYREWLAARFAAATAVRLEATKVVTLRRERLVRRTQGEHRSAKTLERPDVVFRGRLRVESPEGFNGFLLHGIGRHRAFGFGMLLLRPAREAGC